MTSSVYNVHLARQIFHTNFEQEMKLSFNGMSNIIFGQTYYERGLQNFISSHDPEKSNPFFFFRKEDLVSTLSLSWGEIKKARNVFKEGCLLV